MKKKHKKKKNHLSFRLNVLFFFVFLLFSGLILRLGFVQIVQGEEFISQLGRVIEATDRQEAPRGIMYDRYGHVIVDNQVEYSITYTNPSQSTRAETMLAIARELEPLVDMEEESSRVTVRDRKDYLLLNMTEEERYKLVSKEERGSLKNVSEEYRLEIERITDEDVESLTPTDLQVLAIYREMVRGYANSAQKIKQRITMEEKHVISENLDRLPGIDISRDSSRIYPYGDSFRSIFGSVNSIPSEKIDYYLTRGYDRSDSVGTSYLELQYENVLKGKKAIIERVTTRQGTQTIDDSINERPGQRGNDLVLTVDMELQQRLEEIIAEEMRAAGRNSFISDRSAYAVLMDPATGDILAMAGFYDDGKPDRTTFADHDGNVNKVFEMGSSVKAATVLTGFHAGVAAPGTQFNDRPVYLPGTPVKRSWNTSGFGWIDDRRALEQSSNVYMFEIGMRMANCRYTAPNARCGWSNDSIQKAYSDVRNSFHQFGLGSETGIDLPNYSSGLQGQATVGGNLLDLLIGQYDNYTTLQLAQYIATIANDGYRMEPRLVREIRDPSINQSDPGAVIQKFEPTILNRVDMSDAHIRRVQEGLRGVMTRGTAQSRFSGASYQPAGKTGTAQVKVAVGEGDNRRIIDGNTQTLVGYAPYNNPEIAFAVVVPNVRLERHGGAQGIAQKISKKALDSFFEMQGYRNGPTVVDGPMEEE